MKPEKRNNWRGEDYEFQQEFQDVSEVFKEIAAAVPPADLDRQIKKLAYGRMTEELENHWLFGGIPQLSMAVSLMFAIGVFFVVSVDNDEAVYPLAVTSQAAGDFKSAMREPRRVRQMSSRIAKEEQQQAPTDYLQTMTATESFAADSAAQIRYADSAESALQPALRSAPQGSAPQGSAPQAVRLSVPQLKTRAAPATAATGDYRLLEEADAVYPRQALRQGLAGWVLLEFSVSTKGDVLDPVIIDHCAGTVDTNHVDTSHVDTNCADPTNPIFDDEALRAVRQFKYKPRVVGGQAFAVEGVQHRVSFLLPPENGPREQQED